MGLCLWQLCVTSDSNSNAQGRIAHNTDKRGSVGSVHKATFSAGSSLHSLKAEDDCLPPTVALRQSHFTSISELV